MAVRFHPPVALVGGLEVSMKLILPRTAQIATRSDPCRKHPRYNHSRGDGGVKQPNERPSKPATIGRGGGTANVLFLIAINALKSIRMKPKTPGGGDTVVTVAVGKWVSRSGIQGGEGPILSSTAFRTASIYSHEIIDYAFGNSSFRPDPA